MFTMLLKESWNNHKSENKNHWKQIPIADVLMFLYEKGKPIDRIRFDEGETSTVKLHIAILLFFYWNICLYVGVRKHAQFVYPQIQSNGHLFLKHAFWWDQIFTACSNVCVLVFKNNGKPYHNCIGDINIWDIFGGEDVVCFIFSDPTSRWINIDISHLLVLIKMFCMKFRILETQNEIICQSCPYQWKLRNSHFL